jgi:hypothetical protein
MEKFELIHSERITATRKSTVANRDVTSLHLFFAFLKVGKLAHMQAAERGLGRAQLAAERAGATSLAAVLESLRLRSLDQVDNVKTLQEIVVALKAAP